MKTTTKPDMIPLNAGEILREQHRRSTVDRADPDEHILSTLGDIPLPDVGLGLVLSSKEEENQSSAKLWFPPVFPRPPLARKQTSGSHGGRNDVSTVIILFPNKCLILFLKVFGLEYQRRVERL